MVKPLFGSVWEDVGELPGADFPSLKRTPGHSDMEWSSWTRCLEEREIGASNPPPRQ